MRHDFSKMTLKEIGKTILGSFGLFIAGGVTLCGIIYGILSMTEKSYSYEIFKSKAELAYYSTKDDLVKCLDAYIRSIAETSVMNALAFIDVSDKYNLDLRFMVAQAQIESAFATTGIAAKTNSAFNVMAYDGRSAKDMIKKGHGYKHPDLSVEPYARLLVNDYLVGGKTEMDMLVKYVNKNGKRYASSMTYEQSLRNAYDQLLRDTNINALYSEYQKYKTICSK